MSEAADLLRAIASLLWVAIGIAVVIRFAKVLLPRSGQLKTFGVGPTGLTMEFVEAKVDQAINATDQPPGTLIGRAAKPSVVDRLQRNADLLADARILWVDDHPDNNTPIIELLRRLGAVVETPRSNSDALGLLAEARYDVIISDVSRDGEGHNSEMKGVELADGIFARWSQQILLFTAQFNPATLPGRTEGQRLELVRELERTVFGRMNRMDIALHLIMDILER